MGIYVCICIWKGVGIFDNSVGDKGRRGGIGRSSFLFSSYLYFSKAPFIIIIIIVIVIDVLLPGVTVIAIIQRTSIRRQRSRRGIVLRRWRWRWSVWLID